MQQLIGKTIRSIYKNSDATVIRFSTDTGDVTFEAVGDCCSSSWFEHLEGTEALLGGRVSLVESVDAIDSFNDDYGNQTEVMAVAVRTDKGHARIEFRNHSNGYYTGWLEEAAQRARDADIPVTGDF